ncbi:MAG TPA: hypothetical protein VFM68_02945 [Candidatus Saccharimonadales bacterium]|nr:hypothetical protein [Candidatus Saccharimonadales bacterium]
MDKEDLHQSLEGRTVDFDALDHLEGLTRNDYMNTVFQRVKEAEQTLNQETTTTNQQAKLIQQLDESWWYMDQEIPVSGTLHVKTGHLTPELPEYTLVPVDEIELESKGFIILTFGATIDDESIVYRRMALCFKQDDTLVAMLPEDIINTFPDYSPDISERRLLYHHKDEVLRITDRVESSDIAARTPLVMNFTDYAVDILMHAKYDDEYKSDLENYLFKAMDFDNELPYVVSCALTEDDFDDNRTLQFIAQPDAITLVPLINNQQTDGPQRHIPRLELSVFADNPKDPNINVSVPLHTLRQVTPVRQMGNKQ